MCYADGAAKPGRASNHSGEFPDLPPDFLDETSSTQYSTAPMRHRKRLEPNLHLRASDLHGFLENLDYIVFLTLHLRQLAERL